MKITCRNNNGNKVWRNEKGQIHRKNGPAIIDSKGNKFWFQNGKRHRIDGPAREYSNGEKEWWFEDKYIDCKSQKDFEDIVEAYKYMQYILQNVYGDKFILYLKLNKE